MIMNAYNNLTLQTLNATSYTFKHPKNICRNVYETKPKSGESAATVQSASPPIVTVAVVRGYLLKKKQTNNHTTIMAEGNKDPFEGAHTLKFLPDPPSKRFRAGNHVFTRSEAQSCYLLYDLGVCVREMQELYFPTASLEEIIVAIHVGDLIYFNFYNLSELDMLLPGLFDPSNVDLSNWNIGEVQRRRG